ncbi:MAG: dihydrofolate reductase family protein [Chloroflexota bacterium]|nr:dihydrofolate reductase family protein [Chloroflexota bacterium]
MRKVIVSEFVTLDGVMQAPGDVNEDRSGGFGQGGWQLAYFDDVFGSTILDGLASTGGLLLGRRTYEIFAAHWPNQPAEDPLAGTFNELPKYVVSTTLKEPLGWHNSTLIRSDVAGEVARLKDQSGKDIQVIGSGELVQTLIRHDLVDEYRLMVHPIVLGSGKRLFRDGVSPTRLRLLDSKTSSTGVLITAYAPAAEPTA